MSLVSRLLKAVPAVEGWWFDRIHRVLTGGYIHLDRLTLVGQTKQGYEYLPVRPRSARAAFANLPADLALEQFTFVDLGSGKGRLLFLAAEYPFKRIVGVEFAVELHAAACQNIQRSGAGLRPAESVNMDAADYVFPNDPLVIALYNPFGPEVLRKVLDNLNASAAAHPREIVLILLYPESASLIEADTRFHAYKKTRSYHIYRCGAGDLVACL